MQSVAGQVIIVNAVRALRYLKQTGRTQVSTLPEIFRSFQKHSLTFLSTEKYIIFSQKIIYYRGKICGWPAYNSELLQLLDILVIHGGYTYLLSQKFSEA